MKRKKKVKRINLEHAIALYESGKFTLADIAKLQGVSKQAVHAALVRHGIIRPTERVKPDLEKVKAILNEIDQRMPATPKQKEVKN